MGIPFRFLAPTFRDSRDFIAATAASVAAGDAPAGAASARARAA